MTCCLLTYQNDAAILSCNELYVVEPTFTWKLVNSTKQNASDLAFYTVSHVRLSYV